jgi:chitinase
MSLLTFALIIHSLFAPACATGIGATTWELSDPVNLKTLFPEGHIPSDTSDLQYGLITVRPDSKSGAVDPVSSGSGILLAVGESHGLVQLQKRDGQPDPFVFIDCPADVLDQPINQTQKARVICTSQDIDGCFRVRERGVEGTLVEMPEECAPNSFARAISLELAEDQTMPDHLAKRYTPTAPIYEFSFDFNKHERRADAKVAIRMDMTNVKGHWDGLVDSPGVKKRDLERRYVSRLNIDRKTTLQKGDRFHYHSGENSLKFKKDLSTPVFRQAAGNSSSADKHHGDGIAAFVEGKVDANMYYAVTVIVSITLILPIPISISLTGCCRQPQQEALRTLISRKRVATSKSLARRI